MEIWCALVLIYLTVALVLFGLLIQSVNKRRGPGRMAFYALAWPYFVVRVLLG